jgi:hypothetical protein
MTTNELIGEDVRAVLQRTASELKTEVTGLAWQDHKLNRESVLDSLRKIRDWAQSLVNMADGQLKIIDRSAPQLASAYNGSDDGGAEILKRAMVGVAVADTPQAENKLLEMGFATRM